jgi:hypothetical protein
MDLFTILSIIARYILAFSSCMPTGGVHDFRRKKDMSPLKDQF